MRSGFCAKMPWTAPQVQPFSSGNNSAKGLGQLGSTDTGHPPVHRSGLPDRPTAPYSSPAAATFSLRGNSASVTSATAPHTIAPTKILLPLIPIGVPPLFPLVCLLRFPGYYTFSSLAHHLHRIPGVSRFASLPKAQRPRTPEQNCGSPDRAGVPHRFAHPSNACAPRLSIAAIPALAAVRNTLSLIFCLTVVISCV